jgi:hypothetical protein
MIYTFEAVSYRSPEFETVIEHSQALRAPTEPGRRHADS